MKILHLTSSAAAEGCLKQTCKLTAGGRNEVLALDYAFDVDALPSDLSESEIKRCVDMAHSKNSPTEAVFERLDDMDFADFDKVIIWHTGHAQSLLFMYFICKIYNTPLYHVEKDLSESKPLSLDEYKQLVESAKVISSQERKRFVETYSSLLGTDGVPKVVENGKIVCKSKDFVKSMILDELGETPESVYPFVGKVYPNFHKRFGFDFAYIEMMILELIQEEEIIPSAIETEPKDEHQSSFEFSISLDFAFKGKPIKDWFKFSIALA